VASWQINPPACSEVPGLDEPAITSILQQMSEANARTLYERIGGHDGLAQLLRHFYADVRQHAVLGPIFNAQIQDWPAHLAHIEEFWARQTGGPSKYSGGFAAAHLPLGILPSDFQHWLGLWEFNCRRHLASTEADEMIELAHRIGGQLQKILGGRTGLPISSSPPQFKPKS
jgi:hemoglobin